MGKCGFLNVAADRGWSRTKASALVMLSGFDYLY